MRIAVTVSDTEKDARDFLVDVDPEVSVADVLRRMGADGAAAATGDETVSVSGRDIDPRVSLRAAGVRQGAMLAVQRRRAPGATTDVGLVDLGVASGPGAGRVVRLGPGQHVIGSAGASDAAFPALPTEALVVQVDLNMRVQVRAFTLEVHAELAGTLLTDEFVPWPDGAEVLIGGTLLQQRGVTETNAVMEPAEDGSAFDFNRPPRLGFSGVAESFRIPAAPAFQVKNSWPWLAALLPLVGGLVTAIAFGSYKFLAIALLTPVMAFANAYVARRRGGRGHGTKMAEHQATVARIESDIAARHDLERAAMVAAAPSAADLWLIASTPESRLWERRPADDDHLLLRVGTAELPSAIQVEDLREALEYRRRLPTLLHDVPTTVPLGESGVVGIAGAPERTRPVAEWLLAQLAVLQSPRDVQLVVLTAGERSEQWGWAAWLPHATPALGQDARALIGNDADTIGRRVAELVQLIADRQAQASSFGSSRVRFTPDVVVIWDGARRLRSYPGVAGILRDGPAVGVYAICVEDSERSLPEECNSVVVLRPDGHAVVRRSAHEAVQNIRLDEVDQEWFEKVARSLAPIRDTGDDDEDALPSAARLTEVLQLEPVTAERVRDRWAGGARSTRATIGVSLDGPFSIDLVVDGPHGLIAGTTGAGKSELLQSLVASLAVANRPDAMNFVLIDYKGGAAFKDAVRLPHTVGMVTDLDAHLVERALTSLGAELTRREHLLARAGAKDIDDYLAVPDRAPMPRLLIVIDEFASMARELPDFVTGLVNIAQRGRSLGIHLILATQRPSGVVSAEIRANTNLRISLRVTDTADSADVIDAPDAARIPAAVPGRAYVRLGHASLIPFQTARVGGRSPAADAPERVAAPFVAQLGWESAGYPLPVSPRLETVDGEGTDLSRIVDAARTAADDLALPPNHSPWLPALPEVVLRAELEPATEPAARGAESDAPAVDAASDLIAATQSAHGARLPAVPWALADVPSEQAQHPVTLDLERFGHLFIAGASRTGRSQALRTIAGALADSISSADLHLFGIDMGNGALMPLTRLPHTGAVVQRSERERVTRLFDRLQTELTRRQELLGRLGVADIGEQRSQAAVEDRLPHLVVLLDRWESFTSTFADVDAGALIEQVQGFLREGAGAGLHLILAGDRSLLSGRISVLTEDKWILRLADRSDYGMGGLNPRKIPQHVPDGRMLRVSTGQEAQIALLASDPSATAQALALTEIAMRARERDHDVPLSLRPMRIDLLPSTLTWEDAAEYPAAPHDPALWALIGVGGDQLAAVGADLATGAPTFLVAGPPRSGRSNLLATMTRSLLSAGSEIVLICPRRSPLTSIFADQTGVRAIFERADVTADELRAALDSGTGPVVLVIDDGELVRDMPAKDFLREWIRNAAGSGHGVVLGGNAAEVGGGFSGWQTDIRNNQRGALLSPRNPFDGDLLGVRISRSVTAAPVAAGRAIVHLGGGALQTLQVPKLVE
jgi:S-DNA-T family DNA segregation ATPase FtsK/SpoIIIE